MLTDTEIIIEVAKLDGWTLFKSDRAGAWELYKPGSLCSVYLTGGLKECKEEILRLAKPYITSRDAIVPVIEKQPFDIQLRLADLFRPTHTRYTRIEDMLILLRAKPHDLCIALLKATGKWKE